MLFKQIAAGTAVAALLSTTALAGTAVQQDAEMNAETPAASAQVSPGVNDSETRVEDSVQAAKDAASNAVDGAKNMASDAAEATGNAVDDVANAAENTAEDAAKATENTVNDIANAADNTADDIANAADNAGDALMGEREFTSIEQMTVGDVVGMVVYDPEEKAIGEIDYVVVPAGAPSAVIGIGGFLGLGEYTVALPMSEFKLSEDGTFFTLDTTKDALMEQPEFDEAGVEGLPHDLSMAEVMTGTTTMPATGADKPDTMSGS
ncbi:hypothetical protein [Chachezhania sediminis]|uniref:hypothetical protein n=1 Tax=Chachezhania sediminis TaxID=2599291 RepID=UPI00131B3549|nr:hypothetical protein [Chachezhania sediminis]